MTIIVSGIGVDGGAFETEYFEPTLALKQLKQWDHEGSSVELLVQTSERDEVYAILHKLSEDKSEN